MSNIKPFVETNTLESLLIPSGASNTMFPTQTGNAGKFLSTDGTNPVWSSPLPSLTGNSGKYLTTNGSTTSWSDPIALQSGNAGKYLTTNGSTTSWSDPLPTQSGNTGRYLTTNGSTASWNTLVAQNMQLISYYESYTAPTITSGVLSLNLNNSTVFNVNLNANITSITVSGVTAASANSFTVFFTADGTQRTITWSINGSSVRWPAATAPTMTATNGKVDVLSFVTNNGGTTWFGFLGGQNY